MIYHIQNKCKPIYTFDTFNIYLFMTLMLKKMKFKTLA